MGLIGVLACVFLGYMIVDVFVGYKCRSFLALMRCCGVMFVVICNSLFGVCFPGFRYGD